MTEREPDLKKLTLLEVAELGGHNPEAARLKIATRLARKAFQEEIHNSIEVIRDRDDGETRDTF